jgi:hypothetical protein
MSWNSARTDRWIYRSLAVLFTVAAVLRLTLDGTVGAVALGVAGGALLAVIPWLGVRWLMPRLLRKTTEDKIVRDFRSYLSNAPQEDTQPVPIPCDFRVAAMIPPQVPRRRTGSCRCAAAAQPGLCQYGAFQLPARGEDIQAARLADEARHDAPHDLPGSSTRSGSGVSNGMPGPGFSAIRFTLQFKLASSRTTRRASASVSFTPFSSTYSNVSFSQDAADRPCTPPIKSCKMILARDGHQLLPHLLGGRVQRDRQLGAHRLAPQLFDLRNDARGRNRDAPRRNARSLGIRQQARGLHHVRPDSAAARPAPSSRC